MGAGVFGCGGGGVGCGGDGDGDDIESIVVCLFCFVCHVCGFSCAYIGFCLLLYLDCKTMYTK